MWSMCVIVSQIFIIFNKQELFLNTVELAKRIRIHALKMTSRGGSSHIGAALSIADILAVLYGGFLNVDPADPRKPDRDRFILSKGHAGAAVYAALAETGFFPVEKLKTHYQDGSDLSGHVSHKGIPGVELSTGSLGHGLGIGTGMALDAKLSQKMHRVLVLLSDGECDEGSNWEAILFAAHHKLDNLIAIVDYNKYQECIERSACKERQTNGYHCPYYKRGRGLFYGGECCSLALSLCEG